MTRLIDFLTEDNRAVNSAVEQLGGFSPQILAVMDDVISIYERVSKSFGQAASDDHDLREIDECGELLGADAAEAMRLILNSDESHDTIRSPLLARVRAAEDRVMSRRVRAILLGLLWRSYLRAGSDLLRLRSSSMLALVRVQVETAGLIAIMAARPGVASSWHRTVSDVDGKVFFREHERAIMDFADRHALGREYDMGSVAGQHVRLASVAGGYQRHTVERGIRTTESHVVQYLEEAPEPCILILHALGLLRAQIKLMSSFTEGFPEICAASLIDSGLASFVLRLDALFTRLREVFPDKVDEWARPTIRD